ncbi:unnamed protein product [Anisakis simplex]|uniref:ATP-grasp domain-containing protein n=1 Tax=Anisakis simplex TaxID=6269 RepID=A0A0M3KGE2_ANISI|nr:unnamed protein product [Anisakis simplex]
MIACLFSFLPVVSCHIIGSTRTLHRAVPRRAHAKRDDGFRKPANVRIVVVGPSNCVVDESCVDVLHLVECPLSIRDVEHSQLVQKVRELAANYGSTSRRLCAFEKELQRAVAKIRHCIMASQSQPDAWLERAIAQIGAFPMFLKPSASITSCMHTRHIARNEHDFLTWARARAVNVNPSGEYVVEECLQDGYEFTAMCSKAGLIGDYLHLILSHVPIVYRNCFV